MLKTTLQTHLRDILSDEGAVMSDAELDRIIDLTIYDYSLMRPTTSTFDITTSTGTLDYALDETAIGVLSVVNSAATITAAVQFGQSIRFAADPGDGVYTVTATALHEATSGNYATIPNYDLNMLLDIGTYQILERIALDIARRPDIVDGQTSERWRDSASLLYQRAATLRDKVTSNTTDEFVFVG